MIRRGFLVISIVLANVVSGFAWTVKDSVLYMASADKAIAAYEFKDRDDIVKIEFGENSQLSSIGDYAFLGCSNLREAKLPKSLKSLGDGSFRECISLEEIVIPKGVTKLPKGVFSWCTNLKKAKLPKGLTDVGAHSFAYCKSLGEISFPTSVTHIGNNAFSCCERLHRLYLPSSIRELESYAFSDCKNLLEATMPANSCLLGELIFSGCNELRRLINDCPLPAKFDCDSGIFEPDASFNYEQCFLIVPPHTVHRYRIAKGWNYFVHIVEKH